MTYGYELVVAAGAVLAGAIASFAGFGIGSVLTPLLAIRVDAKLAVAAVAIPHVVGTAIFIAVVGVVVGTLSGMRVLPHVPDRGFRRLVALLLLALGTWMILKPA